MKKLKKLSLNTLATELPIIETLELRSFVGGWQNSCVFNCFDYLDGSKYTAEDYYNWTKQGLGYEPDKYGNVNESDIGTIGGYGGFHVKEVGQDESFILQNNGFTTNGERIMMTFNTGGSSASGAQGHAVVVESFYLTLDGRTVFRYYDPTNQCGGSVVGNDYSALYLVKSNE